MKILEHTKNPFITMAINIYNSNEFNVSSFDLINFLLDYEHFKHFDINEQVLVENTSQYNYSYKNETNTYKRNFFNIIFSMNNSFNPDLLEKLISIGMKINPFFQNQDGLINDDILFSRPELDERRNIFLMNLYLKQNGIDDFTQQIKKFNTLHKSVALNKLNLVKFLLEHVSINITNDNLESCIMFAKNPDTLDFLAKYNPNWKQKDIFGNNVSYFFSGHSDDSIKKILLDKFFNYLSASKEADNEENNELIKIRLKETLINLVEKDGTKSELQSFIKKYKIKDSHLITNKNNRTLAHVCIANGDFARSTVFNGNDYFHVDDNGYNIFNSLFRQTNISSSTKLEHVNSIILECLSDKNKAFTEKSFNRLLNDFMTSSNYSIPSWLLNNITLRNKLFETIEYNYGDIDFNNKNSLSNSSEVYFSIFKNLIKKYKLYILDKELLEELFTYNSYNSQYSFEKQFGKTFLELLHVCDNIGKINISEFLDDKFKNINEFLLEIRKKHSIYNKESYSSNELESEIDKSFYSNVCSPFFQFITENKLYNVIEVINEDLMNKVIKNDTKGDLNEFLKTYSYLKINKKLSTSKKIKQNKI